MQEPTINYSNPVSQLLLRPKNSTAKTLQTSKTPATENVVSNLQFQTKNKAMWTISSADMSTAVFNFPELCILQSEQRVTYCIAAICPSFALYKEVSTS